MDNAPSSPFPLPFLSKKEFNEKTKKARDRIGSPPMNYGVSHIYIYRFLLLARTWIRGRRGPLFPQGIYRRVR